MERVVGLAPTVVNNLDKQTDMILERLEDPSREGPWDRRGMVVGSVQSGKTANYVGLICKAVDAGYKLVIVLAGIHSNLRSQTQLRIDEGVLGFDTKKSRRLDKNNRWVGVGRFGERLYIHSLTSSAEDGDFKKGVANTIGVMIGGDPIVLVVKKNSKLLGNLLNWILAVAGTATVSEDGVSKKLTVREYPLLLIDDEADNASINVKARPAGDPDEETVSAINGRIRSILSAFEKSAYVGYTATPFANIFVNPEAQSERLGEDIFPRSFIINVKPPSDYIGPAKVFGLLGDADAGIPPEDPLPIVCKIDDYADEDCFPPRHKKYHRPSRLPGSLGKALRCFVLVCAARRARGQALKHNSMLVHVTRFVDVQAHVVNLLDDELISLRRRIEFGDGGRTPSVLDELRALWHSEFVPVSEEMGDSAGATVSWERVASELHAATSKIKVLAINGYAKEALEYKDYEADGLSVIAVGGDKLSRGLTLEGLSISYFLRTSKMYDTLMQMGRWFGYRPGYVDLCRLYTTKQLVEWYRHIALVEVELRREFDYMVSAHLTPKDYGLRVRTHPEGMIVTALNKMCYGQTLELSWAGVLVQSTALPSDQERITSNRDLTESLLRPLGEPIRKRGDLTSCLWFGAAAADVANYLEGLRLPWESARASGAQLATFIRKQSLKNEPELTTWTVALISNSTAATTARTSIAGHEIGLIERTPESRDGDSFSLKKANIQSPGDQSLDLSFISLTGHLLEQIAPKLTEPADAGVAADGTCKTLFDFALAITRRRITRGELRGKGEGDLPNGRVVREVRPKSHGLLLIYPLLSPSPDTSRLPVIGVAVSFPTSNTVEQVAYRVNRVWAADEDDADYED
jgi:hypothetical protein